MLVCETLKKKKACLQQAPQFYHGEADPGFYHNGPMLILEVDTCTTSASLTLESIIFVRDIS